MENCLSSLLNLPFWKYFLIERIHYTFTILEYFKIKIFVKTKRVSSWKSVLPYLVVCDQIGRFQSLLVGRFSVRSLVVFWSFWGFLAIPIKFWLFGFAVFWQIFKGAVIKVTKIIGSLFALGQSTLLLLYTEKSSFLLQGTC